MIMLARDVGLVALGDEVLEHHLASCMSTVAFCRLANAVARMSAPSSSRMLVCTRLAMNSITSAGTVSFSSAAFLRRIAMRVSRSGGSVSV